MITNNTLSKQAMCCVRVGGQKLQERWQAEQTKRQRVFAFAINWVLVCGEIKP
jgi:hypothetical protein